MAQGRLSQKKFDKFFDYVKEHILAEKVEKDKKSKIQKFVETNLKFDYIGFNHLVLNKLAKIDKKLDISIEIIEMYAFATTYCIARKLNMTVKETNALYDEVERETKHILEHAIKAKEEMRYLSKVFSMKYQKKSSS